MHVTLARRNMTTKRYTKPVSVIATATKHPSLLQCPSSFSNIHRIWIKPRGHGKLLGLRCLRKLLHEAQGCASGHRISGCHLSHCIALRSTIISDPWHQPRMASHGLAIWARHLLHPTISSTPFSCPATKCAQHMQR